MSNLVKTILGFVVAGVIAAGGYFTKAYTVSDAVEIVTDAGKAADACESLLKGQGYAVKTPTETTTEGE